ncbi:unnamed protein product [Pseudo-nitzschia multistriata]|uniref:RanBP2-type domain-containing protein n=1 Tax=Pseudo-nitzschia multistriata TaxID=183589 RepID=A0A448ZBC1_9STRA|nr:unnamed protein product [Pseudo-nitzschia multistriata]
MDISSNNRDESSSSSPSGADASSASDVSGQRWTCEACGCNTNRDSDRTCSICGTRRESGTSILRRAGYAARASGLFGRNAIIMRRNILNDNTDGSGSARELAFRVDEDYTASLVRRNVLNDNNGGSNSEDQQFNFNFEGVLMDDYVDFLEGMDDTIQLGPPDPDEDEHEGLSMAEVAAGAGGDSSSNNNVANYRSAAIRFRVAAAMRRARADNRFVAPSARESTQGLSPEDLLHAANNNDSAYQPKWMDLSQIGGRMRTGNGIEVGEGAEQNVAYLPLGSGEGA